MCCTEKPTFLYPNLGSTCLWLLLRRRIFGPLHAPDLKRKRSLGFQKDCYPATHLYHREFVFVGREQVKVVVKGKAAESQPRNPEVAVPLSLSRFNWAMSDISKNLPVVDLDIFLAGPPASEVVIKECKKVGRNYISSTYF